MVNLEAAGFRLKLVAMGPKNMVSKLSKSLVMAYSKKGTPNKAGNHVYYFNSATYFAQDMPHVQLNPE